MLVTITHPQSHAPVQLNSGQFTMIYQEKIGILTWTTPQENFHIDTLNRKSHTQGEHQERLNDPL